MGRLILAGICNMSYYNNAINEILKFKTVFDDIDPKVPAKLLPVLGEYYVMRELENNQFKNIVHRGGQSGFDILVDSRKNGKQTRIEVKTSRFKSDDSKFKELSYYGWVVEKKNQKNKNKFDVLVCVALNGDYEKPLFYVFTHEEAFHVEEANNKRYTSLRKRIILFKEPDTFNQSVKDKNLLEGTNLELNLNPLKYNNKWDII